MKIPVAFLAACLAAALAGCANAPEVSPMPPADDLFHDALFSPPDVPIDPAEPLALSPGMRDYLTTTLQHSHEDNRLMALVGALRRGGLRLEYDATLTRSAAQAFDARAGNCLSMVLMTSAFAKQMGLSVHYQMVPGEGSWDHTDQLYIAIGHVNLRIEETPDAAERAYSSVGSVVIDFLPPREAERLAAMPIEERTVLAMYMNNRAVESFTHDKVGDAYWWAREALRQDPDWPAAYVTLGVIYRRLHRPEWAEAALERVSRHFPDNLLAMSNRILVLRDLGREAEADALAQRLAELDPHPPFSYFRLGMAALHDGDPETARELFTKEIDRAPFHAEFEYWLAVSYIELHDARQAMTHLQKALEDSTTQKDRDLYSTKLARMKALSSP